MKINILYRFKIYENLVVDDNKNIWELPTLLSRRNKKLRKLTYYKKRDAYRYNNGYLTRTRLKQLMYKSVETYGEIEKEYPF